MASCKAGEGDGAQPVRRMQRNMLERQWKFPAEGIYAGSVHILSSSHLSSV